LAGVPPNMSVRMSDPSPSRPTEWMAAASRPRASSTEVCASTDTEADRSTGPTMLAAVASKASASEPWVATTSPTMGARTYSFSTSRCQSRTACIEVSSRRANSPAMATERCLPPVQPMAMVR
jgi:hypothetical protein